MLVNSSIRDLDGKGMSLSGKAGAARHAVCKFRRAVRVKIKIEEREATWQSSVREEVM